jgi:hypothetical protein
VKLKADGRPLRIGHKGAAALEPENTLRSNDPRIFAGYTHGA